VSVAALEVAMESEKTRLARSRAIATYDRAQYLRLKAATAEMKAAEAEQAARAAAEAYRQAKSEDSTRKANEQLGLLLTGVPGAPIA